MRDTDEPGVTSFPLTHRNPPFSFPTFQPEAGSHPSMCPCLGAAQSHPIASNSSGGDTGVQWDLGTAGTSNSPRSEFLLPTFAGTAASLSRAATQNPKRKHHFYAPSSRLIPAVALCGYSPEHPLQPQLAGDTHNTRFRAVQGSEPGWISGGAFSSLVCRFGRGTVTAVAGMGLW